MKQTRKIKKILLSKPVVEGAGVHLKRVFGFDEVPMFDPFLLLDDFRSSNPNDYIKGFPWHPHRGIETITYVLQGDVEHGDSMGNKGKIGAGDVQWMTAGSGVIHQEMPKGDQYGIMEGFQLWANLPASQKMISPRYRGIRSNEIPKINLNNGIAVKIISGQMEQIKGPVNEITIDPEYFDITVPPNTEYSHPTKLDHTVIVYVFGGTGIFDVEKNKPATNGTVMAFHNGDHILVKTENDDVRFLFISGKPLGESIAWQGPIVMNTQEELGQAFQEYQQGTFVK